MLEPVQMVWLRLNQFFGWIFWLGTICAWLMCGLIPRLNRAQKFSCWEYRHTKAENASSLLQICQKFCYCVKITWLFSFFFWQACITDTFKWFWWWNSVPRLLILGIARRVFRGFWKPLSEKAQKMCKKLQNYCTSWFWHYCCWLHTQTEFYGLVPQICRGNVGNSYPIIKVGS